MRHGKFRDRAVPCYKTTTLPRKTLCNPHFPPIIFFAASPLSPVLSLSSVCPRSLHISFPIWELLHHHLPRLGDRGPGLAPCPVRLPSPQHHQDTLTSLHRRQTATKLCPLLRFQHDPLRRKMHSLGRTTSMRPHVLHPIFLDYRLPPRRVSFLMGIQESYLDPMGQQPQSRVLDESERLVMARTSDCSVLRSYRYRTPRTIP